MAARASRTAFFVAGNLDLAVPPCRTFVRFFNGRDAGALLIPFCTKPEELGAEVEEKARALARELTAQG